MNRRKTRLSRSFALPKTGSSDRLLHHVALSAFVRQRGYAAFTVSESNARTVKRYIQEQARHHRQMSYQEELIALVERHRIQYDEKIGHHGSRRGKQRYRRSAASDENPEP